MISNLQINRTLAAKAVRMSDPKKTVSAQAMQEEWQEIQAAQKDPTSFRPLYERYYESIFRFIHRRTSSEQVTSDLCSQVFLKALQRLPGYEFRGLPFSAWLFRIASNEVAQHFRQVSKGRVVAVEGSGASQMIAEMTEAAGPLEWNNEDLQKALTQALNELKPSELELIEMRFFEHRPFKEISNILNITESNAKVRTYRILGRMKKHIMKII